MQLVLTGQEVPSTGLFTVEGDHSRTAVSPKEWGDTVMGKIYLKLMDQALWKAGSLKFNCRQRMESQKEGRRWTKEMNYSVWMKKENLARVEIRDISFPADGSNLIYDGEKLWSYFVGEKSVVYLDKNTILREVKNVYMTKDIRQDSSLSHDLVNYASGIGMPILYLSKFFGLSSALEEENLIAGFIGEESISGEMMRHIRLVMMNGQRIADYWISPADNLPYKMEEQLIMNASNFFLKRESWSQVILNGEIPDSLFRWEPPDNWKEYSLPSEKILADTVKKNVRNLYESFQHLTLCDGGTFNLRDYQGKIVLIVFWRLGCPPCRKEMPFLQQVYDKYKDRSFMVVGFNHVDNAELVKQYLGKNGIRFPQILDPSPKAKRIYDEFKTNIVPLNCLIDRDGNLLDIWYGFHPNERRLEQILETILPSRKARQIPEQQMNIRLDGKPVNFDGEKTTVGDEKKTNKSVPGGRNIAQIAHRIPEIDLIAEGITYSSSTRSFDIGSIFKGKIIRVNAGDGTVKDFISSGILGLQVLGMTVDDLSGTLWACANGERNGREISAIVRFDLNTGEQLNFLEYSDSVPVLFNDLTLDDHGNVYFTNSSGAVIYWIEAGKDSIIRFYEGKEIEYPNGITISPDNKYLYVASQTHGIRILDINQRVVIGEKDTNFLTTGIDGLKYYQNSLIGIQNGVKTVSDIKIVRYFLDAQGEKITSYKIIDRNNFFFDIPTTFVVVNDQLFCIANSQLLNVNADGTRILNRNLLQETLILKYGL